MKKPKQMIIKMTEPEQIELMEEICFKNIKRVYRKHLEAIITATK